MNRGLVSWVLNQPGIGGAPWDMVADSFWVPTTLSAGEGLFGYGRPGGLGGSWRFTGGASSGLLQGPVLGRLEGVSALTACCWAFATGPGGSNLGRMIDIGNVGSIKLGMQFNNATTNYLFSILGTNNLVATLTHTVANGWHHFAGVWISAAAQNVYVDGIAQTTSGSIASGTFTSASQAALIGNLGGSTRAFQGYLDDVRIWNRALSVAELNAVIADSRSGYRATLVQPPAIYAGFQGAAAATTFRRQWTMRAGSRGAN